MKKTVLASLLAVASLAPLAAFASDGTITFNGSVTAQTCTINGGVPSFTRVLPQVTATNLNAAARTAGATNFSIALTACTPATGGARVFFEAGAGVDAVSGRLLNTGTAANVQLQLLNSTGGVIVAGAPTGTTQNNGAFTPIVGGAATLQYAVQYYATGPATAGTVASSVTYSIEYQ